MKRTFFHPTQAQLEVLGFKRQPKADTADWEQDWVWPHEYRRNYDQRIYLYEDGRVNIEDDEVCVFSGTLPDETFFTQLLEAVDFA
jgi:hypothetical protein